MENVFETLRRLCSDNEALSQQLSDLLTTVSQFASVFQTNADPVHENDNRK